MSEWHDYGYGVNISDLNITSVSRIETLLKKAPKVRALIRAYLEECEIETPTIKDYEMWDYDWGIAAVIAAVMKEDTGMDFISSKDSDNDDLYIIYSPCYPWEMKDAERELTEAKLNEIYTDFLSIVTDDKINPDYQSVPGWSPIWQHLNGVG